MDTDMENRAEIRRRVLADGLGGRAARRESKIHRKALEEILDNPEPPGYRRAKPKRPSILDPLPPVVHPMLEGHKKAPPKRRRTAKRVFDRPQAEHGYTGGPTTVKDAVRAWRRRAAEVFVPPAHPPGEAQADSGHAEVTLDGQAATVALFVTTLTCSDAVSLRAFPRECAEASLEGHVRASRGGRGASRRPRPNCSPRDGPRCRPCHPKASLAARVERPPTDSPSPIRFDADDYSVPTAYAHHEVTALGTIDAVVVVVVVVGRVVAGHRRCRGQEGVSHDPVHYLALLGREPGALDLAPPPRGWEPPVGFGVPRRRPEAELGGPGTRRFIQVPRLLEWASPRDPTRAVERAPELGVADADAVRLILEHGRERTSGMFRPDGRPRLKLVGVPAPDLSAYASLRAGVTPRARPRPGARCRRSTT